MENLVHTLNDAIKAKLNIRRVEYLGLAETAIRRDANSEMGIPALIRTDGEARPTFYDDKTALTIYHRLNNTTYETQRNSGYGDTPKLTATYELAIVACGMRAKINPYTLEHTISRTIAALQVQGYELTPIRSNHNRMQVWSEEYSGLKFPLEMPIFLFKTTYRVTAQQTPCN